MKKHFLIVFLLFLTLKTLSPVFSFDYQKSLTQIELNDANTLFFLLAPAIGIGTLLAEKTIEIIKKELKHYFMFLKVKQNIQRSSSSLRNINPRIKN